MMSKSDIKAAVEKLSGKEYRCVAKVRIYPDHTMVSKRTYYLSDDQWESLKVSLQVREVDYEELTENSIIIIINKRGEGA